MNEEVICTACPKHCVIARLAFSDPPKDSPIPVLDAEGNDIREFCSLNYEPLTTG